MLIGIDASRATVARRTGTEAYSLHLIRALVSLPSEHSYRLYFNGPPPAGLLPAASHVEQCVIPSRRLWTHWRLAAQLFRQRPDLLFVPAHVLPLIFPGPSAVTVHDVGYRLFPRTHPVFDRLYLDWTTRVNTIRAAVLVTDSEATRRDLLTHYRADPRKIVVAYPGYDESLRPVHDAGALAAVQDRYGITGDYLLYIGTIQPRKNLVRLIDAFTSLPATDAPLQLVLAGSSGWLARPIRERARQAGVAVRMPGFVPDEDKAALYSGAAAFLFPSLYEGFGFPILEAMACGTPVVCSNTSSLPEVAGDAALLVDPLDTVAMASAIQRIVSDRSLRDDLAQRGFDNLQRFSWQGCARQVLTAIEQAA
jgi:glycosyltransferase involved in cell wall biosynthesis